MMMAREVKYLYRKQPRTEYNNKNSQNLPINVKLGLAFAVQEN
jgi:hypothetical protein